MPNPDSGSTAILNSTIRVLVVDDEPHVLEFLRGYLDLNPLFHVTTAATASEAEQILSVSHNHIHACLLDLYLPDNGHDRLSVLRSFSERTTFVVISGTSDLPLAVDAYRAGARRVLRKEGLSAELVQTATFDAFLANMIYPAHRFDRQSPLDMAAASLIHTPHSSVTNWAQSVSLTTSALRKLWHRHLPTSRRDLVFLRRLYALLFELGSAHGPHSSLPGTPLRQADIEHLLVHRSRFTQILSRPQSAS